MRASVLILALALAATGAPATAQSAPPIPIEAWSTTQVASLGRRIFAHDRAAWLATDALRAEVSAEDVAGVRGWVVQETDGALTVRFARADGEDLVPGWDVTVGETAGPVTPAPAGAVFSESERARFAARATAGRNIGPLRCGRNMNSVILPDPEGEGWLVWLLASTTQRGAVPIGGHYRFRISADGETVLRRDQLSTSCLTMQKDQSGPNGEPAALVVSQIVSDGPVETHVFLSLLHETPIYVVAGERLFAVEGDRIRTVRRTN